MSAILDLASLADVVLAVTALLLGLWVILTADALRAAIGFLVYGLLMAIVWIRLDAPDIALTEAAIGGGLIGLLVLGASTRVPPAPVARSARRWPLHLLAALLSAAVALGLATVVLSLPDPAPSLAATVAAELPATAVENPVTAVLMAFRAVDTLFETVVLVLALIAFWSLIPDASWRQPLAWLPLPHPSPPLVLLARLLLPLVILVALHLFWIGASLPGGKFQAGALLAGVWALAMVAGVMQPPAATQRLPRLLAVIGPLVFFAIGLAGIWLAGDFLAYPLGVEKPLILLIEAVLLVSVAVVLGLILAGLPDAREDRP
ncbi:hydrogenase subunit MbhD domain-containing protein [Halochromatium roseum]|uniref:hydrogenase subunit MbhD domain-containing protein n=1 Tax=Halochromatium roseum TaxID=391920 RepID=UPI0019122AA9|nr:hydrogenase subunit MbhD domain-containing protein [Halochromatium roseum]MBK5940502.1 sodium:proton antiporter [Halochromatium roseum]